MMASRLQKKARYEAKRAELERITPLNWSLLLAGALVAGFACYSNDCDNPVIKQFARDTGLTESTEELAENFKHSTSPLDEIARIISEHPETYNVHHAIELCCS